jgi:hypothetical protein
MDSIFRNFQSSPDRRRFLIARRIRIASKN